MIKGDFLIMEQRIYDIIFKEDDVTWQTLLHDLVRAEGMDPWDIDISELTAKYIVMLKEIQKMDLRISGKVVLAAAILLKFKSNYLLGEDMLNFDKMLHPEEYTEDDLYAQAAPRPVIDPNEVRLIPKTPQPRKRKVSIYDLVEALKQALEVKKRRREILSAVTITLPDKRVDISIVIEDLYSQIERILGQRDTVKFSELAPSKDKKDIIGIFLPILHLSNQRRIDMEQQVHFGEIEITLPKEEEERKTGSAVNSVANLDKEYDFVSDALNESEKPKRKR